MTLLRKIQSRLAPLFTGSTPNNWWPTVREPYTGAWQLNDPLTTESALANPSVFGCVSRIASDISKIAPPLLLERDRNGFWVEATNPAYSPVLRQPNHYQTSQQFHEQVVLSLLLYGNAYVLKYRDERGVVNAVHLLDALKVKVLTAPDGSIYYELQSNELAGLHADTQPVVVPARELIHMRVNCFGHALVGISPLSALSGAIAQAKAIQDNSTTFFAKGARPSGVLIAPTKLDPLSAARLKTDAANFKSGEILIAELGMKYESVSTTAVDAQVIEQLGWTEEKICEVFGMPVSILNSAKQPPYANAEASQLQYLSGCLERYTISIANGWTTGLELPLYLRVEFDDTLLIHMDTATRMAAAKDAIVSGLSPNEVRDIYHYEGPVPGGELPYLQQQNWPLSTLAKRDPPSAPVAPPPQPSVDEPIGEVVS